MPGSGSSPRSRSSVNSVGGRVWRGRAGIAETPPVRRRPGPDEGSEDSVRARLVSGTLGGEAGGESVLLDANPSTPLRAVRRRPLLNVIAAEAPGASSRSSGAHAENIAESGPTPLPLMALGGATPIVLPPGSQAAPRQAAPPQQPAEAAPHAEASAMRKISGRLDTTTKQAVDKLAEQLAKDIAASARSQLKHTSLTADVLSMVNGKLPGGKNTPNLPFQSPVNANKFSPDHTVLEGEIMTDSGKVCYSFSVEAGVGINDVHRAVHFGKEHIAAVVHLRQTAEHLAHLKTQTSFAKVSEDWSNIIGHNYELAGGLDSGTAGLVWQQEMA